MTKFIYLFIYISVFLPSLHADVRHGQRCYENHIQKKTQVSLKRFVSNHSFEEWLKMRENNYEPLKQLLDNNSEDVEKCIPDIFIAILYNSSHEENPNKMKALKCFSKKLRKPLDIGMHDYEDQHTVLEIVNMFENNADKLLKTEKGSKIKVSKSLTKCFSVILKSMVQDARDSPKPSSIY